MTRRKPLTEAGWLASHSPYEMLQFLHQHCRVGRVPGGQRRHRLYRCACCRSVWDLLPLPCQAAVRVAERFADGEAGRAALLEAGEQLARATPAALLASLRQFDGGSPEARAIRRTESAYSAAQWTVATQFDVRVAHIVGLSAAAVRWLAAPGEVGGPEALDLRAREERAQADLLRDVFGNPFRESPPDLPPRGGAGGGHDLAAAIYAAQSFQDLPVLADALEEAGCTDRDALDHLRGPGPHARGCWVLDAILGR